MSLMSEFDAEVKADAIKVGKKVVEFHGDLKSVAPVDSGEFRDAWELIQDGLLSWTIKNPMHYASELWRGRREINGRMYGSDQWPEGGEPMLQKFNKELKV